MFSQNSRSAAIVGISTIAMVIFLPLTNFYSNTLEYPLVFGKLFYNVLDALHWFWGLEGYFYLPFLPMVSVIVQGLVSLN